VIGEKDQAHLVLDRFLSDTYQRVSVLLSAITAASKQGAMASCILARHLMTIIMCTWTDDKQNEIPRLL
jgi:hypothetical protein